MSKILVIGDSCLDVFVYGSADRLCPDAPVPVFIAEYTKHNGGMAKNVYNNLKNLGADCDIVDNKEVVTKTRYIDKKTNHMFLRVDSGEEKINRCAWLKNIQFSNYSAVIIADYNKGFLLEEDIEYVLQNNDVVFLDTKKLLKSWSSKVPFIKINETEFEKTKHLVTNTDNIIMTLGSKGCRYREQLYPVEKVEVKDSVGAGDTFIAGLAHEYINSYDITKAIKFANACATEVVQRRGVYVINEEARG